MKELIISILLLYLVRPTVQFSEPLEWTSHREFDPAKDLHTPDAWNSAYGNLLEQEEVFLVRLHAPGGTSHILGQWAPLREKKNYVAFAWKTEGSIKQAEFDARKVEFLRRRKAALSWTYAYRENVDPGLMLSVGTTEDNKNVYICRAFQFSENEKIPAGSENVARILSIGRFEIDQFGGETSNGCIINFDGKQVTREHFEFLVINMVGMDTEGVRQAYTTEDYCQRGLCGDFVPES